GITKTQFDLSLSALNTDISTNYVRNTTLSTVRTDISAFKIDVSNNYARNSALTKYDVSLSALASQISSGGGGGGGGGVSLQYLNDNLYMTFPDYYAWLATPLPD
ncbi:MAG: hypothetical protein ACK56F_24540, partial [bacterium]